MLLADELCRYVTFCMARVELLRSCGVVPVLVFDGANLPLKAEEEGTRRRCLLCSYSSETSKTRSAIPAHALTVPLGSEKMRSDVLQHRRARSEQLERAKAHTRAGNTTAAYECYQRAVDISPDTAKRLIEVRTLPPITGLTGSGHAEATARLYPARNPSSLLPSGTQSCTAACTQRLPV